MYSDADLRGKEIENCFLWDCLTHLNQWVANYNKEHETGYLKWIKNFQNDLVISFEVVVLVILILVLTLLLY